MSGQHEWATSWSIDCLQPSTSKGIGPGRPGHLLLSASANEVHNDPGILRGFSGYRVYGRGGMIKVWARGW